MRFSIARRAVVAAAAITLLTVPSVAAESADADGDAVTVGYQSSIDLGTVSPGEDVPFYVYFMVTCSGTSHVNANQSIRLTPGTPTIPAGGAYTVGPLTFALPSGWPADGAACPADLAPYMAGPLYVIVTAPPFEGTGFHYHFTWNRGVTPASADDTGVFSGANPAIDFTLDVVAPPRQNIPPSLVLPDDFTVEGNATGGAIAAYSVMATDPDGASPDVSCSPADGAHLSLGANSIDCTATDSGGDSTTGSFTITVVDTTAPTLAGMPGTANLTTSGSTATLTYVRPMASDIVDPSPSVTCLPASGSAVPVGDTTVTCTARDASGNHTSASFVAHVTSVPPADPPAPPSPPSPPDPPTAPPPPPTAPAAGAHAWWLQPIHAPGTVVVRGARELPVKVRLTLDGKTVKNGRVVLAVTPCAGGGTARTLTLYRHDGRWVGRLWLGGLRPGCYQAVVSVKGKPFGSFTLDVRSHGGPCRSGKGSPRH